MHSTEKIAMIIVVAIVGAAAIWFVVTLIKTWYNSEIIDYVDEEQIEHNSKK